jgi:hypothetical protein
MARRTLNRKDLRADFEAAERRKQPPDEEVEEEEEEVEDDEEEDEAEESEDEAVEADEEADVEVEEAPPPRKRKAAVKEPKPRKSRARVAKVVRMKVVWGVFNNSNQRVAVYDYPKRKEAEDHAAKLMADKKSTHFVQPVKEPIEEKKKDEG